MQRHICSSHLKHTCIHFKLLRAPTPKQIHPIPTSATIHMHTCNHWSHHVLTRMWSIPLSI
uniref:Uncharacterized protein n=1 Tax=Arundo donax TaxID=35708 RepID=A0A0A8YTQ1_ARUDO